MRNKLKKIWNKEDGFTLVELLGVIVILGIILAIAIPGIGNIIDNADKKTALQQEELVIDAAQMYYLDGGEEDPVLIKTLTDEGYLETKKGLDKIEIVSVPKDKALGTTTTTPPAGEGN